MRAKLVEYKSKYYGTKIQIYFSDDEYDFEEVVIWNSGSTKPSIRQIKYRNNVLTQEDYDNNIEIESYTNHGEFRPIQEEIVPTDSHFETEESYLRALKLIETINKQ